MKCMSYQQFAIVQGDTAESLTEQLNAKMKELNSKNPTVTFEGLIARISYTETDREPECLTDEYEAKGVNLFCEDCPYFVPERNANGTIDRRAKKGKCQFAHYGLTQKDCKACERLFEMIQSGEVRLCLAD